MSDSSDAESSDDDLLASPVFKKRDRRTERAEKNKLDFLDSCLKGSNARTDVHRRIASVEEEFKKDQEEAAEAEGEEEGSADEAEKKAGAGSSDVGDGKENVQNNAASEPTGAKSDKNDEDAYWERIESFAEQNAQAKTPGAVHSARRKINDAVSGLDYASDLTDDEGGKWKDGVSGMTREQMRSEAEAKSQGLSSKLGLRPMFRPAGAEKKVARRMEAMAVSGEEGTESYMFYSRKEALAELKSVVSSLLKSHRSPKAQPEKILRKQFIDPLTKIVKKPNDCVWDTLGYFLRKNPVIAGKYAVVLPAPFCKWMWKLGCSSFEVGQQCSTDCFRLVRKFLLKELDVCKDVPSFAVDMAFLKNFCMDDLVSCLENDFGLWLEHGSMIQNKCDDTDSPKDKDSRTTDIYCLKNIFVMWTALFRRNLVQSPGINEDNNAFGEEATKVLVALTRAGLDPHFYSANNTCGESLQAVIQKLTSSLVRSTAIQIHKQSDKSHVEQWMNQAAGRVVDACSDLSEGDENAADSDDVNGHLPLAMAVTKMGTCELDEDFSVEVALMKLNFAEQALHRCLKQIPDWEVKVKERTDFLCKDWKNDASEIPARALLKHVIHAMVTAEVGFQWIDEELDSFLNLGNHPHFLAASLIAGECALGGSCIFWCTQTGSQSEEPVFGTEEKDSVHECMSNLEDLCDGLKKKCRAVMAFPHLRRTKEYLTRLSKMLGGTKGKSSKDKRQRRREQGSLDSYFSRPSMSDPFQDSQDS